MKRCLLLTALLTCWIGTPGRAASVLMISIDGMKPEYVTHADEHGLRLPYLRGLLAGGTYAEGVVGVWPTVTYPSHTTLVTGVSPAAHGILANLQFDPGHRFQEAWYWYASQIRVPTLWQAAHARGLVTASIGWPVTVGATGIDYLIPEYWRTSGTPEQLDPSERSLIAALAVPNDLLQRLQEAAGPYMPGNDTAPSGDAIKIRYGIEVLRRFKPALMTLHLSSLDDAEHDHGVYSPQANASLEAIDAGLIQLTAAARAVDPATVAVIVSDHGFTPMHHEVNLDIPFIRAGFMTLRTDPDTGALDVASWRAQPWLADGMAAIMLQDPHDLATRQAVLTMLRHLAADPRNGIDSILDRSRMDAVGAFPGAEFLVVFKPGYDAGTHLTGPMLGQVRGTHGDHGFSPDAPDMRASFFAAGDGIARHRDLGVIPMQRIAPTIGRLLGFELPGVTAEPLPLGP